MCRKCQNFIMTLMAAMENLVKVEAAILQTVEVNMEMKCQVEAVLDKTNSCLKTKLQGKHLKEAHDRLPIGLQSQCGKFDIQDQSIGEHQLKETKRA